MNNIFYAVLIFYGSLLLGYGLKKAYILKEPFAKRLTKFIITFISPAILAISFWGIDFSELKILTLPLIGLAVSLMCALPAYIFALRLRFDPQKTGVFIVASMFSNVGYPLGAFLCFVLFGEAGFGLAIMYCLYWSGLFYTLGFYFASRYGRVGNGAFQPAEDLKLFPILGIVIGVLLNILNITRHPMMSNINSILIPISTAGFLFSAGLTLRFSKVRSFFRPCLAMSAIKFLYAPLVGFMLSMLLGYNDFMQGLPLKVVLIESSMPVALSIMVLPQIFKLDQDLANSLWLFTTFLLIAVIPALFSIIKIFT